MYAVEQLSGKMIVPAFLTDVLTVHHYGDTSLIATVCHYFVFRAHFQTMCSRKVLQCYSYKMFSIMFVYYLLKIKITPAVR